MAEIKIEKKKPIWPWIILVLVILAILYFLVFADDGDDDDIDEITTEQVEDETAWEEESDTTTWETESDTLGQGVQGYLTYVADESRMGIDHEYTNNALIQLMNAVQAKADEMNYDISADMQSVRQEAQAITQDPMATTHANTIKSAGTKLANILQKMQQEQFPNLNNDVQEVMTAANNIDGSVQTLNQKDQVNKFFNEAADVLRKMS
jgi:hypothetical protein